MSTAWWQTAVIYQIYPRSFQDSGGDGVGDLQGIIDRLDYLNDGGENRASLGVDAIWISPFYPSPMVDHGYDVADYCDVDPIFGNLETFDRLLAAAHARGLKVIIDFVPNHTSDRHPWFVDSRSGRASAKREWYIWADPAPGGGPPNNWGSFFGGPAWTFDAATGQYYLHQFVKEQPELNWRHPEVREAMFDVIRFWLDRGVDGFRVDVINLILKDPELRDNPPHPHVNVDALHPNDVKGRTLPLYTEDLDEVHPLLRAMRSVFDEYDDRVLIGELWGSLERWARYYGSDLDEVHLPFNFRLMDEPWETAADVRAQIEAMEAAVPPGGWPNYVLGNHDRSRPATRFGLRGRAAAMMLLTLRGTPTLYYADELGMEDVPIPPEKIQDPQARGLGAGRSRDVARTPMQWDASPHAGFSTVEPWLPVEAGWRVRNVAVQLEDPRSYLALFRGLLSLRRASPALNRGTYASLGNHPDVFAYRRQAGEERMIILLNFGKEGQVFSAGEGVGWLLLSTGLDREGPVSLDRVWLRPYEGVIITPDR